MVRFYLIQFRMIFILLIFSLIADQVSGQVALIPKLQGGDLGKGWSIGRHREQRNPFLKINFLDVIVTRPHRLLACTYFKLKF